LYDVGAGAGQVSRFLRDAGYFPIALDTAARERSDYKVLMADGASYLYQPGSVVMICRPCHGPFVEFTIGQALKRKAACVVYVGLKKNVAEDLGRYRRQFKAVATGVGDDGENVWILQKSEPIQ
jgi:hypothetical protein